MFIQTGICVSGEGPSFDLLPAAMHLRIQYLGVVVLIEASKQKELDTIESSVERLRMKQESLFVGAEDGNNSPRPEYVLKYRIILSTAVK